MKQYSLLKHKGLSLIELMVALAVSSILLLGVATIYTASKRSYSTNTAWSNLQENGRFAIHTLTSEIRQAGYSGCSEIGAVPINILSTTIPDGFNPGNTPAGEIPQALFGVNDYVKGHIVTAINDATPSFEIGLEPNNAVKGTHAITIRKLSSCSESLLDNVTPNGNNRNITVTNSCNFKTGEVLVITNCTLSYMFTNTGSGANLVLNTNRNSAAPEGEDFLDKFNSQNNSKVMRVEAITYYIGEETPGGLKHLYVNRLEKLGASYVPRQRLLIPNVEDMVISYGVDTSLDNVGGQNESNSVDVLVAADGVATQVIDGALLTNPGDTPWSRITRVDIRLLIASEDNLASKPRPYTFNNDSYDGSDKAMPTDHRYRSEFVSAINLRNRTP